MAKTKAPTDTVTMLKQIRALEQEFGVEAYETPKGRLHVRFTDETGVVDNSNPPRLRLAMQVVCGPSKNRKISDFLNYFADPSKESEKSLDQRRGESKSMFVRRLAGIVLALTEDADRSSVYNAWRGLPRDNQEGDPNTLEEAEDTFGNIADALVDTEAQVESGVNRKGYNSVAYIKWPSPVACGCVGPRANPFEDEEAKAELPF